MKLILLGAPGSGKGTQAEVICDRLGIPAVSTGNIIREAIKQGTEAGLKAKSHVDSGGLVPDEIVVEMLRERLGEDDCKSGYILDGFPRNVNQARTLDKMGIVIDKVINIEVADECIVNRMSGRRVCSSCGSSYHVIYKAPMKKPGKCDRCGGDLATRDDDRPETVRERLRIYHEQTAPLKDYYDAAGKLFVVEGQEELADTTKLTIAALEA
ncbi:MAG: adenylate kinase [Oscillospiraceae bacterium]|nr:adenylate kinase [Oscillospiraceae bacterium]